jgi:hypothetical protein
MWTSRHETPARRLNGIRRALDMPVQRRTDDDDVSSGYPYGSNLSRKENA